MHGSQKLVSVTLALALALVSFSASLAAPVTQALPACVADPVTGKISGTVTAVDEAGGMVTVDTGGGAFCTVKISTDATHPIALLLGVYFGDLTSDSIVQALTDSQGCATTDGVSWTWADCAAPGAVQVKVTGVNPDGTYIAVNLTDGTPIASLVVSDPETQEKLNGALEELLVEWALEGDGNLMQVSDQVAALHEQGIGFGVLVKLFAIAQASGGTVTVEELLAQVQAGAGMGELFKTYGKPDKTGVGHVRQEVTDKGNGNGQGQHPGNGNLPPGQEKKADQTPKDKPDKVKETCNPNNGNGKGKPACR
jgi:hypothetical protein